MKLRRLPEAFKAGWSAFRATLFLPQRKSMTFIGELPPCEPNRGDIWIDSGMELRIFTGRRWKSLIRPKKSLIKRYLTRLRK